MKKQPWDLASDFYLEYTVKVSTGICIITSRVWLGGLSGMTKPDLRYHQSNAENDPTWLQGELSEAHKTIRTLLRQLSKEQERHAETVRAYNLTVANLVEATRENTLLARELDQLRARTVQGTHPFTIGSEVMQLTPAEVSAIRKAMARLHHPDVGGDSERMKIWNAVLDPLEGE